MKPWVKRHPCVALALLAAMFPFYLVWHVAAHLPEALRDWLYEWHVIYAHAKGASVSGNPQ